MANDVIRIVKRRFDLSSGALRRDEAINDPSGGSKKRYATGHCEYPSYNVNESAVNHMGQQV